MNGDRTPGLRPRRLTPEPDTPEPVRRGIVVRQRAAALLSATWSAIRPTRNRATGYIAIGAVGALVGTSAVVGVGAAGAVPDLADIGAWLGSSEKGNATHANGLTGDVDGKVDLPTGKHPVSISQDGKTVLVLDKKTGKVIRLDPSQLTAEQSTEYGSSNLQLVAGGTNAYVVNPLKGTVQRIDPVTTAPKGALVELGVRPLGKAVVDPKGTLWVPAPTKGKVIPFPGGRKGKALKVAKPRHALEMTLANGEPVVTDTTGAITTMLTVKAPAQRIKLPSFIKDAAPETVLVPETTDGDVVPVLAAESGKMTLVNTRTADQTTASIGRGSSDYGKPQVLGSKVYVPDHADGSLRVYDTAESAVEEKIQVTKEPGELEVFVRNGLLWVNDQDNAAAAVINPDGKFKAIGKYKTDVPSARKPKDDTPPVQDNVPNPPPAPNPGPVAPGPQNPGNPGGNDGGDRGSDKGGDKPAPDPAPGKPGKPDKPPVDPCEADPSQCDTAPPPVPPGTPQAQSGPNGVTVTFSPSSGVKPERYTLGGAPAGANVNPGQVGADGPFQFSVSGLSCSQEYSFTVTAHFKGGETAQSQGSPPVRPCTAPSAPRNLNIQVPQGGHGANLTWQPPANASGSVTYTVSWPGGSTQTQGTAHNITGLRNGQQYNISVTSNNEAGGGQAASGTANLIPPAQTMNIAHNDNNDEPLAVRTQPTTQSGSRVTTIPGNSSPAVTVHCKTRGSNERHPFTGASSDYWGHITYNGKTGYVADIYLDSRNNPNVWDCT